MDANTRRRSNRQEPYYAPWFFGSVDLDCGACEKYLDSVENTDPETYACPKPTTLFVVAKVLGVGGEKGLRWARVSRNGRKHNQYAALPPIRQTLPPRLEHADWDTAPARKLRRVLELAQTHDNAPPAGSLHKLVSEAVSASVPRTATEFYYPSETNTVVCRECGSERSFERARVEDQAEAAIHRRVPNILI